MKRRSPVRHKVRAHTREGSPVKSYNRGKGKRSQRPHKAVKRRTNTSSPEEFILSTHKIKPTNEIYRLVKDKEALDRVLSQNLLRTSYNGKDYVVSFTANPSLRELFIYPWEYEYRLVLDFSRLRNKRPLVPVYYNGEISPPEEVQDYYKKLGIEDVEEYGDNVTIYKWAEYDFESEWVSYRNILNLKKYLLRVESV